MKPQEVKPKVQTDWLGFCKGGALLSTKWTFVRVVYAQKKLSHMIYVRQPQPLLFWLPYAQCAALRQAGHMP